MGVQSFGEKFDLTKLIRAREVARDITYELSSIISPGMIEEDAHRLYKDLCKKYNIQKQWHPPKLRFGPNTICNFKDESKPYALQEEDIFFIDIGPVVEGHEADYGETFSIGPNFEFKKICEAQRKVFSEVRNYWLATKATGPHLYEFAKERAKASGFVLNDGQDGHRIGDFPHHVFFRGSLVDLTEQIIPNAWILEIHLWAEGRKYGAFYEDLLTDSSL